MEGVRMHGSARPRVLIVDDDRAQSHFLSAHLMRRSYDVSSAATGDEAIRMFRVFDPALVLLDADARGMEGMETLERLKQIKPDVSVIMTASSGAPEKIFRASKLGADDFITKPIDPAELKTKVCRTLNLETLYKYFQQRDGALALMLPKDFHPDVVQEVSKNLESQLINTVDAGGDKLIIDLNAVENFSLPVIELALSAIQAAGKLSLRFAVVGSESTKSQCRGYEETQSWLFAGSFEQALALLK